MHQQFPGSKRIVVKTVSEIIGADMTVLQEYLAIRDGGVTILQVSLPKPQRLDLGPRERNAGLKGLENKIIMPGPAVCRDVLPFPFRHTNPFPRLKTGFLLTFDVYKDSLTDC
jgi:hypothetical protein